MVQKIPAESYFSSHNAIVHARGPEIAERLETYRRFMTGIRSVILFHVALISFAALTFVSHGHLVFGAVVAAFELWIGFLMISRAARAPV